MLRKERKWHQIKCSIKATKGRNKRQKTRATNKTVTNMVNINPTTESL